MNVCFLSTPQETADCPDSTISEVARVMPLPQLAERTWFEFAIMPRTSAWSRHKIIHVKCVIFDSCSFFLILLNLC